MDGGGALDDNRGDGIRLIVAARFGRPSNYSLTPRELSAHIRHLCQLGWQSWEIRARFDTRRAA